MQGASRRPRKLNFAVGVETSPEGADLWEQGRPYRLHAVVSADDLETAIFAWRGTYGREPNICLSLNPAHAEVVRLRGAARLPC